MSTAKPIRKARKGAQQIARASGRYSSSAEANKAGKKSHQRLMHDFGEMGIKKPIKRHLPKQSGKGRM